MRFFHLLLLAALAVPSMAHANVVHVLAFRYKQSVTPVQRATFARRLVALQQTAKRNGRPYIVSIRGGDGVSAEGFDQRLDQLFIIEFKTTADRDFFVGPPYVDTMDPEHRRVADLIEPNVERDVAGKPTGLFVFDFIDTASR